MSQATPPPIEPQKGATPRAKRRRKVLLVCSLILAVPVAAGLMLFRIYGLETHHDDRSSIWWSERGRQLIPPAATDITLSQDFLDHRALYTISESDLNVFLNRAFSTRGEKLDSFSERSPLGPAKLGESIGTLGWVVTKNAVSYSYYKGNGTAHHFYHDPDSGLTYQTSAYW